MIITDNKPHLDKSVLNFHLEVDCLANKASIVLTKKIFSIGLSI